MLLILNLECMSEKEVLSYINIHLIFSLAEVCVSKEPFELNEGNFDVICQNFVSINSLVERDNLRHLKMYWCATSCLHSDLKRTGGCWFLMHRRIL